MSANAPLHLRLAPSEGSGRGECFAQHNMVVDMIAEEQDEPRIDGVTLVLGATVVQRKPRSAEVIWGGEIRRENQGTHRIRSG